MISPYRLKIKLVVLLNKVNHLACIKYIKKTSNGKAKSKKHKKCKQTVKNQILDVRVYINKQTNRFDKKIHAILKNLKNMENFAVHM